MYLNGKPIINMPALLPSGLLIMSQLLDLTTKMNFFRTETANTYLVCITLIGQVGRSVLMMNLRLVDLILLLLLLL